MKKQLDLTGLLLLLSLVFLYFTPAEATVHRYVEDFFTKQYCDTLNTTALWDSVAGELRLPSFAMTVIGNYNTGGYAQGIAVSGNYAYVADYSAGLKVINISDPSAPTFAGSYDTPGDAINVTIAGDYAYVPMPLPVSR